jgi:hypothetical protein
MSTATLSTQRRCPYCGALVTLGDCSIVATSFSGVEFFRDAEDYDLSEIQLPSGSTPLDLLPKSRWPVVARPPRERVVRPAEPERRRSKLEEAFAMTATVEEEEVDAELPPLLTGDVHPEDLPARACTSCEFPLPQTIDERRAVVVAVVGVNRVGKTHLIASSLTQAYRSRGLAAIGCTEFAPDDTTGTRFLTEYYYPLFRRGEILSMTLAEDDEVRFRPLIFNVTIDGVEPFSLVLHDVAGEVLGDHRKRAHSAAYLRGARGIIFVVDPRDIDDLRDGMPDWVLESNELGWDQGALLSACVRSDGILQGRKPIPLAVTIAKADLLPAASGEDVGFLTPAPVGESREDLVARLRTSSGEVAAFLERHGAHSVLGPARAYEDRLRSSNSSARVTYHAVSALGSMPDADERLNEKVRPINCLDPLAAILLQIVSG